MPLQDAFFSVWSFKESGSIKGNLSQVISAIHLYLMWEGITQKTVKKRAMCVCADPHTCEENVHPEHKRKSKETTTKVFSSKYSFGKPVSKGH